MNMPVRNVLITGVDEIALALTQRYVEQGHRVLVAARSTQEHRACAGAISGTKAPHIIVQHDAAGVVAAAVGALGRLDAVVLCTQAVDEDLAWETDPRALFAEVREHLRDVYTLCRDAVNHMVLWKKGTIVLPIVFDSLVYSGFPSSPIRDQAKIAFAKSLAKEVAPFRISVSVMSLGHYDRGYDSRVKRGIADRLEIFSLKPRVRSLCDMVSALDFAVLGSDPTISGQNIHVATGQQVTL